MTRSLPWRSASPSSNAEVTLDEVESWYRHGTFTTDWHSHHRALWIAMLKPLRDRALGALEIGSWEGRSALFLLNYLPQARLVCIDTFAGSDEHRGTVKAGWARALPDIERRFDANLAPFAARLEKIKQPSNAALAALGLARRRFDVIYVDGSHRAADAFSDGVLAWPLLNAGGMMIFDDYEWDLMPDESDRPRAGIDAFLWAIAGQYRPLHFGQQALLQKN